MPPKEKRKLSNLFYVCYAELCRKRNLPTLSIIKSGSNQNKAVLDIAVDRIKYDEWGPILNALSYDNSLHFLALRCRLHPKRINEDLDTENKIRQNATASKCPILTKFILDCLMDSITNLVSNTQFLSVLVLEGIPLSQECLLNLTRGLSKNTTVQHLHLPHCLVGDDGCEILARTLRYVSNVCTLDLSDCNLSAKGIGHIADLIKYQKIFRYSESWKQALRYREPDLEGMRGLRRLTVNNNPNIGDEGLCMLFEVLQDDLWMKAIDLQNCGITDIAVQKISELLTYNGIIDIIDLRRNPRISMPNLQNIMMMLCKNCPMDSREQKFQWLGTTSTLNGCSSTNIHNNRRPSSQQSNPLHLSLSASNTKSATSTKTDGLLKRSNTTYALVKASSEISTVSSKPCEVWKPAKIPALIECKPSVAEQLKEAKHKIHQLQMQLNDEIIERKRLESLNVQLHSQLMEFVGRSGGVGDTGGNHKNGYVSVQKEVLEEIYKTFSQFFGGLLETKTNGVSKVKINHPLFNKLQSIIEESPHTSPGRRSENEYSQSPRLVNSSGDTQIEESSKQSEMEKYKSPRARQLFNAFLTSPSDEQSSEAEDDDDTVEIYENDFYNSTTITNHRRKK